MVDILEVTIKRMNDRALEEFSDMDSFIKDNLKSFKSFQEEMRNNMLHYKNNERITPNARYNQIRASKRVAETSFSDDEINVSSRRVKLHNASENSEKTTSKSKRNAAIAAEKNIKKTSNMKLNSKMRKPSIEKFIPAYIKIEKKSESMLLEESINKKSCLLDITHEMNMPPPISKPKRGRKKARTNMETLSPAIIKIMKENDIRNCTVALNRETYNISHENATKEFNLNDTKILTIKQKDSKEGHNKINLLPNNSNLLTDDDDSIEICVHTKTPIKKESVKTKPMLSPYGSNSVKKQVVAFEKLVTADVPARVTRTKTRNFVASKKDQTNSVEKTPANQIIPASSTTAKSKNHFTLLTHSKIPSSTASVDRQNKLNKNISVVSEASTTWKTSHAEKIQERREEEQKRKLEHENEVKRKKDALLQAKIEEQRRKREEKQMKAQKVREAKEREKEEKIRRVIQEKQEKLQREEQLKKEWMAKKAAEDEKHQQMIKQKKIMDERRLNKKPPPLPTNDLQDSDDEENSPKQKYVGPFWSQTDYLNTTLKCQQFIPSITVKTFFLMEAQTPDLLEIFENIDPEILRRNSSAVWRTPPRYSTLPRF